MLILCIYGFAAPTSPPIKHSLSLALRLQTRGRSAPRPRSASPVGRPSSRTPAPASNSFGYSAPAPAANGLSAEQAAFLERKARESRSPAPMEVRN